MLSPSRLTAFWWMCAVRDEIGMYKNNIYCVNANRLKPNMMRARRARRENNVSTMKRNEQILYFCLNGKYIWHILGCCFNLFTLRYQCVGSRPRRSLFTSDCLSFIAFHFNCFLIVHSKADIHDHLSQRRSSYNIEYGRGRGGASGSASKVDLLKSALEINHKSSNSSVTSKTDRTSNPSLNRYRADSAPKLNLGASKTLVIPSDPVLEVIIRVFRILCDTGNCD